MQSPSKLTFPLLSDFVEHRFQNIFLLRLIFVRIIQFSDVYTDSSQFFRRNIQWLHGSEYSPCNHIQVTGVIRKSCWFCQIIAVAMAHEFWCLNGSFFCPNHQLKSNTFSATFNSHQARMYFGAKLPQELFQFCIFSESNSIVDLCWDWFSDLFDKISIRNEYLTSFNA